MADKGLTPPTKRSVKKVLNRSADRVMKSPKNVQVLGKIQDRLIRSTGIKDPFKVTGKAWDLNTKAMNRKIFTETFQKNKGLTPPTEKLANKVIKKSDKRAFRALRANSFLSPDKNFKEYNNALESNSRNTRALKRKYPASFNAKQVKINKAIDRGFKLIDMASNVEFGVRKVVKNMGKLSPAGLVGAIMQPKKVGDATLKGNQGEYKRVK